VADELGGLRPDGRVFRLIRRDHVVPLEHGGTRPQSGEFSDSSYDGAMSVFVEDWIVARGETVAGLRAKFPGRRVSWMRVREYTELNQVIGNEPQDDFFPGHAGVRDLGGKRSAGTKTKMAVQSRWLDEDDDRPIDDVPGSP
jgi:hypothetical protein